MKKIFLVYSMLILSLLCFAQDQTVNGIINQNLNNTWLSPAKLQLGRENDLMYKDRAVIGVTSGNLHLDAYPGYKLYLNFYQQDSRGGKGMVVIPNGNVGIGLIEPQYKLHVDGDVSTSGWYRVDNNRGIYFQTYGGGLHMVDSKWIRTYGNKSFYHYGEIMRTDGILQVGPDGDRLIVNSNGNVGVGIKKPTNKLEVNGTIRSKEVKIEATDWSDFVFDKSYKLPTLSEVESHISQHKHLPNIPSQAEVIEQGINVGEMQAKLLQKIEELTLYVIEQDKKIELQQKRISVLEKK